MLTIAFALIFYRIGSTDYGKGWPTAVLSILASFAGAAIASFASADSTTAIIGVVGANILLYIVLFIFNVTRKAPSASPSGSSSLPFFLMLLGAAGGAYWFYHVRSVGVPEPAPASVPKFATVAEAQREAVRRYPELGVAGSKLNREFIARHSGPSICATHHGPCDWLKN
jgi:hypothetical protein